jgi:hypothetical protein
MMNDNRDDLQEPQADEPQADAPMPETPTQEAAAPEPEPGTAEANAEAASAPPVAPPPPAGDETVCSDPDARQWGMFAHLAAFLGLLGIPAGNVIGPLIVWLIKRDEMPFVDRQGKNALNFQISMLIYAMVAGLSVFILVGLLLLPAVIIFQIVVTVLAGLRANEGKTYEYPLTIQFIK